MDLKLHQKGPLSNLVALEDIKDSITNFDLIVFRGGDLASQLISVLEKYELGAGTFTHVGMIVTSDILPICNLTPGKLYLYQSTFTYNVPYIVDGVSDVTTGKGYFGVQLCDFDEVVPTYISSKRTKVAHCKLVNNPWNRRQNESNEDLNLRREQLQKDFTLFFNNHQETPYEMNPLSLLGVVFPFLNSIRDNEEYIIRKLIKKLNKWDFNIKENNNFLASQFCSELVSNVYKLIGVLPANINPENMSPMSFFYTDSLVCAPRYIKDWNYNGKKAVKY